MSKTQWHAGSASVILLPGGVIGSELEQLIAEWTQSWMLKPAFWITEGQVQQSLAGPPRIMARVTGRNGSQVVDLFPQLSRLDIQNIRVIAARVVGSDCKIDRAQDEAVAIIEKYMEQSRPLITRNNGVSEGISILKVNLVFAPTEQKGASFVELLENHWDVNLVVAPEDRSTPNSFDGFTRYEDTQKMNGFILSNIASTAGLWSGQQKSIFELSNQFADLSPIQNQVRVMRTFVRGILSEGLAIRVAAEALRRAGSASESQIDGLRSVPNKHLVAYEKSQAGRVIDQMVEDSLNFENGALQYKRIKQESKIPVDSDTSVAPLEQAAPDNPVVKANPDALVAPKNATGVFGALKFFFRSSWSLIKVLPLWFFAAFWNFIARAVTLKLFGSRGREVARGTIDFPRTDLDKDATRNLDEIADRRSKVKLVLESWPRNTLRKSEPTLWSDLRKIVVGRMDGSTLPRGLEHERDSSGTRVLGDLNQVLPSLHETWSLPPGIQRVLESDPRSANWQEMDVLEGIESFLESTVGSAQTELNRLTERLHHLEDETAKVNEELKTQVNKMSDLKYRNESTKRVGV